MDDETFSKLVVASEKALSNGRQFAQHRYLFNELENASGNFYNGIYGLRGVGKTVLLLQLANRAEKPLYVPADAKYLLQDSIYDMVNVAVARGYRNIFIDEINSRSGWTSDIKTLYDEGEVKIIFTGSSAIELRKGADLSRRVIMHELKPASFREYLNIKKNAEVGKIVLTQLFNPETRAKLASRYSRWKELLQEYCKYGGVLYEGLEKEFPKSIANSLEKIIGTDLTYLRELDIKVENDIYKLLYRIAASGPYEASYTQLAGYLEISKATVIKLIADLEKVGLLRLLYPCAGGFRKEPKIYIRIPFRYAINEMASKRTDIGILREEFFANNVDAGCYYKTRRGEKTPDFRVGGKIIEVGGENKKSVEADYIAVDGINFAGNKIPLFLFGFLY